MRIKTNTAVVSEYLFVRNIELLNWSSKMTINGDNEVL